MVEIGEKKVPVYKVCDGAGRYDDIIDVDWEKVRGAAGGMSLENRAKIFLPFAALTGFEAEIRRRKGEVILRQDECGGKIKFEEGDEVII